MISDESRYNRDEEGDIDREGADVPSLGCGSDQETRRSRNTASNESCQAVRDPENTGNGLRRKCSSPVNALIPCLLTEWLLHFYMSVLTNINQVSPLDPQLQPRDR